MTEKPSVTDLQLVMHEVEIAMWHAFKDALARHGIKAPDWAADHVIADSLWISPTVQQLYEEHYGVKEKGHGVDIRNPRSVLMMPPEKVTAYTNLPD